MDIIKKRYFMLLLGIILCLTFGAYSNVIDGEFQFDDYTSIQTNLNIKNIENFGDINVYKSFLDGGRPITDLTFAINYYYGRLDSVGYHLVSIFLHLLTAVAVLLLAREMFRVGEGEDLRWKWIFLLVSTAVFALHPINTQAVSYVVQRSEILSTFFYIISLMFFVNSMRGYRMYLKVLFYLLGALAFVLALGSKLTAITLPLVLFLYDLIFEEGRGFRKRLVFYLPVAGSAAIMSIFYVSRLGTTQSMGFSIIGLDPYHYLLTQFRVIVTYIRLLLLPVGQNLDYSYRLSISIFEWDTFLSLALIIGLLLTAFMLRKRNKIASFGILWFFITLLPTSSFIPVIDLIFEHRVYLPSIGFSFFVSTVIVWIIRTSEGMFDRKRVYFSSAAVILLLLSALALTTFQRNEVWRDRISLWSSVASGSPNKVRAFMNLGQALSEKGFYQESVDTLLKGLSLADDGSVRREELYRELGVSYYYLRRIQDAVEAYMEGRKYAPFDAALLNNLSIALMDLGHIDEARSYIELCMSLNPRFGDAYNTAGTLYLKTSEYEKAKQSFLRAIEFNPDVPLRYWNAAITMEALGESQMAYEYYARYYQIEKDENLRHEAMYRAGKLVEKLQGESSGIPNRRTWK